jgi:LAS superfamily LD-carboxypeptidase LdcB
MSLVKRLSRKKTLAIALLFIVSLELGFLLLAAMRPQSGVVLAGTWQRLAYANVVHAAGNIDGSVVRYEPGVSREQLFAPAQAGEVGDRVISTPQQPLMLASCNDCRYFPVNKRNALPSTYKPTVVATGLPGGGMVTAETKDALKELFAAAKKAGLSPKVNSSYRSYEDQLETFAYWVRSELNKGKSQAEAETLANRYSARPGLSEHQLGTTVDINCNSCSPFDTSSKGNNGIWKFLEENAHKYGFVISYPKNQEAITGYVYEPWHLRFVGKELAAELFATGYVKGNGQNLAALLLEKKLYVNM